MQPTTILIADDHTLVRETWSYILNRDPHYSVIGESATGESAIEMARQLRPRVVIMDINMPGINGIEATEQITRNSPDTRVLGVSLHTQPSYAKKMMQKGASGYVTKNSPSDEMFRAIQEIVSGGKYICDEIKNNLSEQVMEGNDSFSLINSLSQRELEVVALIRKGNSSREIAEALNISVKTVEVHRYNTLRKLGLKNSAALVNFINQHQVEIGF